MASNQSIVDITPDDLSKLDTASLQEVSAALRASTKVKQQIKDGTVPTPLDRGIIDG